MNDKFDQLRPHWKEKEDLVRRRLEDLGFFVCDANILFRENCPNIDLVIFGRFRAIYAQVKASTKPAGAEAVLVDGSPWTQEQLFEGAPIYNKRQWAQRAELIIIVHTNRAGDLEFYIVPPEELELLALQTGRAFASKPKRDGGVRKMFRKEIPLSNLEPWRDKWQQVNSLDNPCMIVPVKAKLAALAAYAPLLSKMAGVEPLPRGAGPAPTELHELGGPALTKLGENFCAMIYDTGWIEPGFDWQRWSQSEEGIRLRREPGALETATAPQLSRLLTALVRVDRFIEGSLADAFQKGLMSAIANRAAALLEPNRPILGA